MEARRAEGREAVRGLVRVGAKVRGRDEISFRVRVRVRVRIRVRV